MRTIKKRKPRGVKKNGQRSLDLCPCCLSFRCDPSTMSRKFHDKVYKRIKTGVCPACGHNPCKCKSSLTGQRKVLR